MAADRQPADILQAARQMLDFARMGQRDFGHAAERTLPGFHNAVTSGRSVTFVLQGLVGKVDGAEEWYERVRQQLKADPVCKWFVEVRNRIEKQGTAGQRAVVLNATVSTDEMMRNAPPFTTSFFVADVLGRCGWNVVLPEGTEHIVFFRLPPEVGRVDLLIRDAPDNRPVAQLVEHYLSTLEVIVDDAEERFGA